tara:strand:- start:1473 stop:2660 length:1188 start_codon:yes stop_codon:yes gene_type:complete
MKSKLLSIDNIFEEVRDRVVWIKFKHLNMPEDKPKLNQYLKRLILEHGLKEPIYIQSTLKVSDGYNRLMCLKDIITNIDDVKIPCIMTSFTTTTDIKKRQKELYKMDIDKFRGGRAIPDLQVKSFWKNIDADELSNVITNNTNTAETFVDTFDEWIRGSKLNNIKGLLNYKTFIAGTSQAFDTFWMRHHDKRFRCFQGEFFYHKANWKKFHKWEYIDNRDIAWGDAVVISYPFSDYCKEHSEMKNILDRCEKSKVPVLIDCAYYVIAKDLDFDFSNYSCVEDIVFSLSKGFYQANKLRAGIRYSRYFRDDNIDMYNEWEQLNHVGAYLGTKLLNEFPPDYAVNLFKDRQLKYCEEHNLKPADCVSFAFGGNEYQDLNRGTDVNRLCIADQIGDKV